MSVPPTAMGNVGSLSPGGNAIAGLSSNAPSTPGTSLGNLSGVLNGYFNSQNYANSNNNVANYAGNTPLQAWNVNNNGVGASMGGNTFNANMSPFLSSAGTGLQGLASLGTGSALNFMGGLPSNITGAYGQYGQNFGQANSGMLGISDPSGLQRLIQQAQGGAGNLINTAGSDFSSVYNSQLQNLRSQLALPQQLQMNANRSNQFATGQLGTTGGALQTMGMAQGFGQADLGAAQQAYAQALGAQNSATQNAGILGTLSSNQQLTGMNLFNNLNNLGANNLNLQGQYATMPSSLAGTTLNNLVNPALTGNNNINQLGLSNLQLALQGGTALSNSNANAAGALSRNPFVGNTGATSALGGASSLLNALGTPNSPLAKLLGGGGNALSSMFGGGSGGSFTPDQSAIMGSMGGNYGLDTSLSGGDASSGLNYIDSSSLAQPWQDSGSYFNGAGGQAAAAGGTAGSNPLSALGSAYGAVQGLSSGRPIGEVSGALNAAKTYNTLTGGSRANPTLGAGMGVAGGLLGMYTGMKQGGVMGYGGAAVGGLGAASGAAQLAGNTALSGALGTAAGAVAAPLDAYQTYQGIKSGNVGMSALSGAETGAAIGSIIPGLGTVVGGVIGGVVGGVGALAHGKYTNAEITNPNEGQTIKLQSGNSALMNDGVAYGAGSDRTKGSAQWFLDPAQSGSLDFKNGAQNYNASGAPSVQKGDPFYIGSQGSQILTNFANSVPMKGGSPDFSSAISQYTKDPHATTGLVGVYNNNGGQAMWGVPFNEWVQGIWHDKNGVTGNLGTN